MAKTATPKQGLLAITRQLRAVLPGKVKKLTPTRWLIEGKVKVELNYFCRYSPTEKRKEQHRTCNPHSISVNLHSGNSRVFRARTISKRRDGSFNLESIATVVTKALGAFADYEKAEAEKKKNQAIIDARINGEVKRLTGIYRNAKESVRRRTRGSYMSLRGIDVAVRLHEPDGEFSYRISGFNLDTKSLEALLGAIPIDVSIE
jgi:hypothetical protein